MTNNVLARYQLDNGDQITLTAQTIRNQISTNPNVTEQEVLAFAALCKAQRLNPFTREAHLIKYGSNPATMVVGKDVFTKRAQANPKYRGMQAGLTLVTSDNRLVRREGSMALDGETIVGAWCKVYVEGYAEPMFDEVSFNEYAGRKRDGSLNQTWAGKPGTMIRKVAIVHALREAFPADFAGLYDSAEMGVEPAKLPEQPVAQPEPVDVEVLEPEPAQDVNRPAEPATQPETGMAEADIEF